MSLRNSCRVDVVNTLRDLLGDDLLHPELTGVTILDGNDYKAAMNETILIGDIKGVSGAIRDMRMGRKARKDEFTVDLWIMAGKQGQLTPQTARGRALEMLTVLEDILADDPHLNALPSLYRAQLGTYDGPDVEPGNEGWSAYVTAHIECESNLL